MVVLLVTIFIAGLLADRFGNLLVMAISAFGIVVLAIPLFHILTLGQPSVIMASQMIFAVLLGLYIGAQPGLIVLHSPKAVRCTALAIGYNVTLGLVGGTSPLMASWLIERLEDNAAPGYLIAGMAALSFCALWSFLRKAKSIKSAPS
jgi:MHS family proline/betaine transporter-like MFS transporter